MHVELARWVIGNEVNLLVRYAYSKLKGPPIPEWRCVYNADWYRNMNPARNRTTVTCYPR